MKNKRIWLVIVCILVVGVLVTRYTSSVVNRGEPSQEMAAGGGAEMRMAEVEAEAAPAAGAGAMPETTAGSPSPAVKEKRSVQDAPTTQVEESGMTGVQEDEAFAEAAPATGGQSSGRPGCSGSVGIGRTRSDSRNRSRPGFRSRFRCAWSLLRNGSLLRCRKRPGSRPRGGFDHSFHAGLSPGRRRRPC